jgi:tRNA A-37 threonylcarbamoyl transferase component Bud32
MNKNKDSNSIPIRLTEKRIVRFDDDGSAKDSYSNLSYRDSLGADDKAYLVYSNSNSRTPTIRAGSINMVEKVHTHGSEYVSPVKNKDTFGSSNSLVFNLNMMSPNRDRELPYNRTNTADLVFKVQTPINESPEKKRITLQLTKKLEQIPPFDFTKIIMKNQIGEGSFGKIYKVIYEGRLMAMKKLLFEDEERLIKNKLEYRIMNTYKDTNIPEIYGCFEKRLDPTTICLYVLMELAVSDLDRDIQDRAKTQAYYTEKELIKILKQLTAVFAMLQKFDIAHGDVKPSNILVTDDNLYKVTDFGEAINCVLVGKVKSKGTELFISPEKFFDLHSDGEQIFNKFKSDCYSLGLTMIYAASLSLTPLYEIKKEQNNINLSKVIRYYVENNYSRTFCEVLYRMTNFTEDKRTDFFDLQEVLNSLF